MPTAPTSPGRNGGHSHQAWWVSHEGNRDVGDFHGSMQQAASIDRAGAQPFRLDLGISPEKRAEIGAYVRRLSCTDALTVAL